MKSNRFIKRLDWYIIKKFLGTYVFAIALIISIAVVFDFNEKMDKLLKVKSKTILILCAIPGNIVMIHILPSLLILPTQLSI